MLRLMHPMYCDPEDVRLVHVEECMYGALGGRNERLFSCSGTSMYALFMDSALVLDSEIYLKPHRTEDGVLIPAVGPMRLARVLVPSGNAAATVLVVESAEMCIYFGALPILELLDAARHCYPDTLACVLEWRVCVVNDATGHPVVPLHKYRSTPGLHSFLLSTAPSPIEERTTDSYWGTGSRSEGGNGKNMLGRLLCEVRASLLE